MKYVRKAADRGHSNHGWLDSWHTFSFADYHDAGHMGFRALRVINDDRVAPGAGFGTHPHRDMEIVSYVVLGGLEHKDSIGTGSVIRPGDVQRMSAGTGIRHSEYNASREEAVHFLQIWILPERNGIEPGYEQKAFAPAERTDRLRLVADRHGSDGALSIHQDVKLYATTLTPGAGLDIPLAAGRYAWLQVVKGSVRASGESLAAGDGLALANEPTLRLESADGAELLLFDLA
jgi:redox-sensitive bicupin YhaK (pirin superfamily)